MARLARIAPWAHNPDHAEFSEVSTAMPALAAPAPKQPLNLDAGGVHDDPIAARRIEAQVRAEERRSMSRILHDDIGQSLTALSMKLAMLRARTSGALRAQVLDAHKLLQKTLEQVQRLSKGLHPSAVEDLGLVPALRSCVQKFSTDSAIGLQLKAPESQLSTLDSVLAVAVFRSVEALLSDLPAASSTLLILAVKDGALQLEVRTRMAGREPVAPLPDVSGFQEQVLVAGGTVKLRVGRNQALITARFPMTNHGTVN
jgi:signal transduction histidine kinase